MSSRKSTHQPAKAGKPGAHPAAVAPAIYTAGHADKITPEHLARWAIVYIRQSQLQQLVDHPESRARQYELADYAQALGWPNERVLLIDDDQGRSGTTTEQRSGFQRLLAEVALTHVGLILGLEMSRLCRSNRDWAHLSDLCGVCHTLLGDQDGLYDPNDVNDRLVLGLKGIVSEMELTMMRNRLERGRQHKAARGELFQLVPLGYVKLPEGGVAFDPDEQVRAVVRLLFDKYDQLGSVYGLWRYLRREQICLGIRVQQGPQRGSLQWRPACAQTLYAMLRHPMYAGAYAFGRRRRRPVGASAGGPAQPTLRLLPQAEWQVLLRDRVPAYITWERYEANGQRLHDHRQRLGCLGSPRAGAALLAGLLVCGQCGGRYAVNYPKPKAGYYYCTRHYRVLEHPRCPGIAAPAVDAGVAEEVLHALEPAALALSLQALHDLEAQRARLEEHWQQRLQRAGYEVARAERQYQAVEPENRLVVRTLEQRWEQALHAQRQAQEDYDRFRQQQPARLTQAESARIQSLAQDMPALWQAPTTTPAQHKEIIRCLVDQVVVTTCHGAPEAALAIHWKGGRPTERTCRRSLASYAAMPDRAAILERVQSWRAQGYTAERIAARLSAEGFRPPKRRDTFTAEMARNLLRECGLRDERSHPELLGKDEWWVRDLMAKLGVSRQSVCDWIRRGWVHARPTPIRKFWRVWANAAELRRLRKLVAATKPGHRPDTSLTKPGKPPKH